MSKAQTQLAAEAQRCGSLQEGILSAGTSLRAQLSMQGSGCSAACLLLSVGSTAAILPSQTAFVQEGVPNLRWMGSCTDLSQSL